MKYNFDEVIDRSNNYAAKFCESVLHYGTNDVIPLWIADMDFRTAPCVVEAIQARAEQGIFGYTYRPDEYFESIINWEVTRNGWKPDVDKMAYANGVIPGLRMLLLLTTTPEDKIIIQQPGYHPFADVVHDTGRQLVINPLLRDEHYFYTMDYEDLEAKCKAGAKYFILCNPHNPTGRCWTPEELKQACDICVRYGVEIISDEIHSDLMLDGHKHTVTATLSPEIAAMTTTCIAPSKTFNLAGLQAATMVFRSQDLRDAYVKEHRRMDIFRNNCFSLVATMAAYNHGAEWLDELLVYLSDNMKFIRSFCADRLPMLKMGVPESTYLYWIDANELGFKDDEELSQFFVRKAGVAFGYGPDFGLGGSGFIRVNAACPRSTLEKAFTQVEKAVRNR